MTTSEVIELNGFIQKNDGTDWTTEEAEAWSDKFFEWLNEQSLGYAGTYGWPTIHGEVPVSPDGQAEPQCSQRYIHYKTGECFQCGEPVSQAEDPSQ